MNIVGYMERKVCIEIKRDNTSYMKEISSTEDKSKFILFRKLNKILFKLNSSIFTIILVIRDLRIINIGVCASSW